MRLLLIRSGAELPLVRPFSRGTAPFFCAPFVECLQQFGNQCLQVLRIALVARRLAEFFPVSLVDAHGLLLPSRSADRPLAVYGCLIPDGRRCKSISNRGACRERTDSQDVSSALVPEMNSWATSDWVIVIRFLPQPSVPEGCQVFVGFRYGVRSMYGVLEIDNHN